MRSNRSQTTSVARPEERFVFPALTTQPSFHIMSLHVAADCASSWAALESPGEELSSVNMQVQSLYEQCEARPVSGVSRWGVTKTDPN